MIMIKKIFFVVLSLWSSFAYGREDIKVAEDLRLNHTMWRGGGFCLFDKDRYTIPLNAEKDTAVWYDICFTFASFPNMNEALLSMLTAGSLSMEKTKDAKQLRMWEAIDKSTNGKLSAETQFDGRGLIKVVVCENNRLLTEMFNCQYGLEEDKIFFEMPRVSDTVRYATEDDITPKMSDIVSVRKKGQDLTGVWDFGGYKLSLLSRPPRSLVEKVVNFPLMLNVDSKRISKLGIASNREGNLNKLGFVYWVEKGFFFMSIEDHSVLKFPYELSKDGNTLRVVLKKDSEEMEQRILSDEMEKMGVPRVNSMTDSLLLMDSYNYFKNDSSLKTSIVQRNKKDFFRIVNAMYTCGKRMFGFGMVDPYILFPDARKILNPQAMRPMYESGLDSLMNITLRYETQGGDTVSAVMMGEHRMAAMKTVKRLIFVVPYSYDHHTSDVALMGLNYTYNEKTRALMERFVEDAKQHYVENMVSLSEALMTREDSISFAQGYLAVENISVPQANRNPYAYLRGLTEGYEKRMAAPYSSEDGTVCLISKENIGEDAFVQYVLGTQCGAECQERENYSYYLAGACCGYSGKTLKWKKEDMYAFLKKNK